jgi:hypothetical protein
MAPCLRAINRCKMAWIITYSFNISFLFIYCGGLFTLPTRIVRTQKEPIKK